jgi:hypothetical protein
VPASEARKRLWVLWVLFAASLALLQPVLVRLVPRRQQPWNAAEAAVAGFVLALLALPLAVSTFAGRETLREESGGTARFTLYTIWARCLLVGFLGCVLAYGAGSPQATWPFIAGGAVLLLIHAPRGAR